MGKVIVDAGAWQLAMNVLRRDAADGMHVRAEIVAELEKATFSLSDEWRLVPTEPTHEMRLKGQERLPGDIPGRAAYAADAYRAMVDSAVPPN